MRRANPSLRISAAIALMSVSVLMVADILGLIPDNSELVIRERSEVIEEIGRTVQKYVLRDEPALIASALRRLVRSNREVIGAYVEDTNGKILAHIGNIEPAQALADDASPNYTVLSVNSVRGHWGDVAIAFRAIGGSSISGALRHPVVRLAIFLGLAGFLVYEFYLRRVLRHLDPTAVMPERVRTIMDALAEGVVLIDEKGQIVMTNIAFAQTVNIDVREIPGRDLSVFDWGYPGDAELIRPPWEATVENGVAHESVLITLTVPSRGRRYFSLYVAPIMDDAGNVRGALATFDDQTEIVQKNNELRKALKTLSEQQARIEKQNEELTLLATRDPLTGCLNRRAFFDIFDREFVASRKRFRALACIMCDIDHFKGINDNFGHSTGDKVIKAMAEAVKQTVRENDHVCRYGGEEFCVLLPGIDAAAAAQIAERVRTEVEARVAAETGLAGQREVTASFGVSDLGNGAADLAGLIDQADGALYESKEAGRNRVTVFRAAPAGETAPSAANA